MWHEKRDQQHRAYWRKPGGGRDYEPFSTELEVRTFISLCKRYGRAQVVARHRARASDASVTMVSAPASPVEHDTAVPALAAGLSAPVPAGISLAWLGEQYVSSGNKGNDNTRADYRRDLTRYVLPFFGGRADGDVDIAMVMTRPLPTASGSPWPWPTITAWKQWLADQPRHDRHGEPIAGTRLAEKTRRNIESLLAQLFNFALAYDPQPLLGRNPCTTLGLIRAEQDECVWLELAAARLLLKHLDPWYFLLVTFLLATGVGWGEAAALQVKDIHLGDGTDADPPYVLVHKTWKRIGKAGTRTKTDSRRRRKDAKFVWGRGRTKTDAGRRRITLTQGIRKQLLPLLARRDPQAPVFTAKGGGILHNSNFTGRSLKPALAAARTDLALLRADAPDAQALARLPLEIPDIRPHAFRHTNAAWLLSAGVPEGEVQRRLGHADPMTTRRLYGHITREASQATLRFLEDHFAPLMLIGRGAVTAAEDASIDAIDAIDAALPLVDDDDLEDEDNPKDNKDLAA
ncbi:MAG: site-specific integrase [Actinomycetota bacterium]